MIFYFELTSIFLFYWNDDRKFTPTIGEDDMLMTVYGRLDILHSSSKIQNTCFHCINLLFKVYTYNVHFNKWKSSQIIIMNYEL